MEPFVNLDAIAAPLDRPNVDTDQILPSRFLRRPRKDGFASFLFRDLRFNADGTEDPGFVLNQAAYRHARILVADRNFGGGSSREQAPWGLVDYGIRCVIAADFGDIFHRNSLKSGLLPLQLNQSVCVEPREHLHAFPGATLRIDLPQQRVIRPNGTYHDFKIDPFSKHCLLEGLDDIGFTLQYDLEISSFELSYRERFAWLFDSKS